MECRSLDLTLISAKGLKNASLAGKMDVYAVASISGTFQKLKTPVSKRGGPNPTWNFPMKFTVHEAAAIQNHLTLIVKIKSVGLFMNRELGQVHVPIKELMEDMKSDGKTMQFVSYHVRRPSGKPKGDLSFSYKFGEKFSVKAAEEPVTAYPLGSGVGSSSGYQPPSVYGGYPPQQAPVSPRSGIDLLGAALGGMILGCVFSDDGGSCGGGCGGGGCRGF